jgi:RNA polymerase sigma-70 factor, ECF subfamily
VLPGVPHRRLNLRSGRSTAFGTSNGGVTRDDRQLVAEAAAGSRAAGSELFERHWPTAWRLAYSVSRDRAAADDIAQDAFERAFRGLETFNGRSSFRTWLCRIVVNRAVDVTRAAKGWVELEEGTAVAPGGEDDAVEDRDLLDAVAALPLERRVVVALRYWGRFTPPEIAETLDLPVGTVHSRLARALTDLRSRLEVSDVH